MGRTEGLTADGTDPTTLWPVSAIFWRSCFAFDMSRTKIAWDEKE